MRNSNSYCECLKYKNQLQKEARVLDHNTRWYSYYGGKKFLQNFISGSDRPVKVQKEGMDENTQEAYPAKMEQWWKRMTRTVPYIIRCKVHVVFRCSRYKVAFWSFFSDFLQVHPYLKFCKYLFPLNNIMLESSSPHDYFLTRCILQVVSRSQTVYRRNGLDNWRWTFCSAFHRK